MRAILVYRLPEEQDAYDAAMQGRAAQALIWDIDQRLRSVLKHGDPSEETAALCEELRQMIREEPGLGE